MRHHHLLFIAWFLVAITLSGCATSTIQGHEDRQSYAEVELSNRIKGGYSLLSDPVSGTILMRQVAERTGNAELQYLVGEDYFRGVGVDLNPTLGIQWLKKAADQNFAPAQSELAFIYLTGQGVAKDFSLALSLAQKAAKAGESAGMVALGDMAYSGWGVPQDETVALAWYVKSADKKNSMAMMRLGYALHSSKAIHADDVLAYAWFANAAKTVQTPKERAEAQKAADNIALVLLPDDLTLAKRLSDEWKPGSDLLKMRVVLMQTPADASADTIISSSETTAATKPSENPFLIKLLTRDIDVQPDGSYTSITHSELMAKNDSAAREIGERQLTFSESLDTMEILEAYTLKPDGRKLPVNISAIHMQLIPGATDVPLFSDQRQKVIVFPSVEAGDVVVYTAKLIAKPYFHGVYFRSESFNKIWAFNNLKVTITTPKTFPLYVETHDLTFKKSELNGKNVYEWNYANPNPPNQYNIGLDELDRAPRFFISSLKSYDQFARLSYGLMSPKLQITSALKAKADELTQGVTDRKKQAELIYNWVREHIRYVMVKIGTDGAYIPHEADMILSNGYGDCKDHSTLFSALLKAKNISSDLVIINSGNSYSLPAYPALGSLNHMITYIPEFNLYADTTVGVAPFGILPFDEYGKPVVHLTETGTTALRRTPLVPKGFAETTIKTTARMNANGSMTGDSETVASGPFSVDLRQTGLRVQSLGTEQAAKNVLRSNGYEGSGRYEIVSPYSSERSYRFRSHFVTNPRADLIGGNSFYLPWATGIGWRPGEVLLGNLDNVDLDEHEPTPCFSGQEIQETTLELPEGKHVRELPQNTDITYKSATYKSVWSQTGRTVTVRREFSTSVDSPICLGELRYFASKALNRIRGDYLSAIAIVND